MSRGGRGGRGRGGGRGGFGGGALPPMGLTFADIQAMSREGTALYPPMHPPVLTDFTEDELKISRLQQGFPARLRQSQYYVVEKTKNTELPRYSDKYRTSMSSRPTLQKKNLNPEFFPTDIFETYFNPKRKRKNAQAPMASNKLKLDELDEGDEPEQSDAENSNVGSQAPSSDYDVDEEYDNDYAENYFDNGEGDDNDDLGGGAAGDDRGDYD